VAVAPPATVLVRVWPQRRRPSMSRVFVTNDS
jgi:hypothetical protein